MASILRMLNRRRKGLSGREIAAKLDANLVLVNGLLKSLQKRGKITLVPGTKRWVKKDL